jgi:hypothetical protein
LECYFDPRSNNLTHYDEALAQGVKTSIKVVKQHNIETQLLDSKYLPTTLITKKPNGNIYAKDLILYTKEKSDDGIISTTIVSLLDKIQELEERIQ